MAVANHAEAGGESRLAALVQARPLTAFFVLTYGLAWLLWAPLVVTGDEEPTGLKFLLLLLGTLVPSSVGIFLVAVLHGKAGVRKLLGRLKIWRVGWGWWAVVAFVPAFGAIAVGVNMLLGADGPDVTVTIPGAVILFVFFVFPGSAGGEELGWRGFALPQMQRRGTALRASVILGAVWGTWHLPLYLTGSDLRPLSVFAPWVLATIATSILLTWMYNGTGGSLLLIVLFHAASNLGLTIFLEPYEDDIARSFLIFVALMVVAAVAVVVATGPATLSRSRPKQVDVP